ncbi:MAG: glycosyltransferase [Anaerolineales bacterium]|nr:glycosyltransferase [Anaerolineales bacterium]
MELSFPGKLGIQQRILPHYRGEFFEGLAQRCDGGLSVVAGKAGVQETVIEVTELSKTRYVPCHNIHFLSANSPFYLLWQKGVLRWLQGWDPDVLIIEANHRYLSTRTAIRWMHTRGRPVIGWGLGVYQPGGVGRKINFRGSIHEWWRHNLLKLCDGFISYSKKGAEQFRALGIADERVFVAPNAVIQKPVWPFPVRPDKVDERLTVLFVGRLQSRKKIDNLLIACNGLSESVQPNVWIVGDGPERSKLESLANSIYPRARFFGALHGNQVAKYFKSADLFVLPGTGGLAVQEAMAYGLPVIVAEGDGTQDQLINPHNGWLIPKNDIRSLRDCLQESLSDLGRLRIMGHESYRIVCEEYNLGKMIDNFIEAVSAIHSLNRNLRHSEET